MPHLCSSRNKWTFMKEQSTEIPHAPISPAGYTGSKQHAISQSRQIHEEIVSIQVDTSRKQTGLELTLKNTIQGIHV